MNSSVLASCLLACVFLFLCLGSCPSSAQTFQYSRGWTNGKRNPGGLQLTGQDLVERIISNPCQLEKLRYVLQAKPASEKMMASCDLLDNEEAAAGGLRLRRQAQELV